MPSRGRVEPYLDSSGRRARRAESSGVEFGGLDRIGGVTECRVEWGDKIGTVTECRVGWGEVARPTKRQEALRDDVLGERRRGARSKPIQSFSIFVFSFFPSYSVLLSHLPPIAPAPRSCQGGRVGGRGA